MNYLFSNNATSRLQYDTPAASSTVTVQAGDGAFFPSPAAPEIFMVTLEDRRTGQVEICTCTQRSGDVLTVVRAQEGTIAQDFLYGATVSNRLTAGTITGWQFYVEDVGGYKKSEADALFVDVAGDTMTGDLLLPRTGSDPMHAVNRGYVDTQLAGKAAAVHTHPIADIINLQTTLDLKIGEAPTDGGAYARQSAGWVVSVTRTEFLDGISTIQGEINDINSELSGHEARITNLEADTGGGGGGGTPSWDDITDKPSTFPPSAHTHPISEVTGLQPALDGKEPTIATGPAGTFWANDKTWQVPPSGGGGGGIADATVPNSLRSPGAWVPGQPFITAGTTAQYWRGDKTWATLDKAAVGLGNVDNTSDANKPVSTAQAAAIAGKENTITAGTTAQYWRGDKSWQTLDKAAVGLGNVDNTSDANKPVSTAQQTALNLKANIASPTFTGTVQAPTPTTGDSSTIVATTAFVKAQNYLTAVPAGYAPLASPVFTGDPQAPTPAPSDNDTSIATTAYVTSAAGLKANIASPTFTGVPAAPTATAGTATTQLATTAFVANAVTAVGGAYVPIAGGTMTGQLNINSNVVINGLDSELVIDDSSPLSEANASLFAWKRNGKARWRMFLDGSEPASGNQGSNWRVARYADDGNFIDNPFSMARNDGSAAFARDVGIQGTLFAFGPTTHTGAVVCNGTFQAKSGTHIVTAGTLALQVSNGTQFFNAVTADGYAFKCGGPIDINGGSNFSGGGIVGTSSVPLTMADVWNTASGTTANMNVLSSGRICKISSMRAAKKDITPLMPEVGDSIMDLRPSSFRFRNDPLGVVHYGFVADELETADPHFPTWGIEPKRDEMFNVILDDKGEVDMSGGEVPNGVDPVAIIAALVLQVQKLTKRIEALEAA